MTRFWTRFIEPFRKEKKNKKKLPVIVFDEYAKPLSYLRESHLYGRHLVRIDKLEQAYNLLVLHPKRKSYWRMMDPLIQIWYSELERVCHQSQNALKVLTAQLDDLSYTLQTVSSPLKNRDRNSSKKAQQFISTCLKELESKNPNLSTSTEAINESSISTINVREPYSDQQDTIFVETAQQHRKRAEKRDSQFQAYYQEMEGRIHQEIWSNKNNNNSRLRQCIRQIYRLEQALYLHHHYIISQFSILWDLGSVCMESLLTYHHHEEPNLYPAMQMKWQQQYNNQLKPYQGLERKFKEILKSSTPDRRDFTCAVCLSILHEPTTLVDCHHTFCRSCIQHMYCTHCYQHRAKPMSRISENLGSLLFKPAPSVYCTCYIIDRISGEPTLKNQHKAVCPLCRTAFRPDQCTINVTLEKYISLYFPKRKHDNDDDDDCLYHKEEEKDKKKKRESKNGSGTPRNDLTEEEGAVVSLNDRRRRRRSQVTATKFYSTMQRWSNKLVQNDSSAATIYGEEEHVIPPVPPISITTTSQRLENDMLLLARRSWMV